MFKFLLISVLLTSITATAEVRCRLAEFPHKDQTPHDESIKCSNGKAEIIISTTKGLFKYADDRGNYCEKPMWMKQPPSCNNPSQFMWQETPVELIKDDRNNVYTMTEIDQGLKPLATMFR